MNALAFLLLASQVSYIFTRLTVIHRELSYWRKAFTCISEDDGGALVWNKEISREPYEQPVPFRHEGESQSSDKDSIDCQMNENSDCLKLWITDNWSLTNSLRTPLGPVFDRRWEDFQEYTNFNMEYDPIMLENTTAFSFSVRVQFYDVQILFCNGADFANDFCYWILIGGWGNMRSAIRRCSIGAPRPRMQASDRGCEEDKDFYDHSPLSSVEWRTFFVTWDVTTRNISLYDPIDDTVFMKYRDTENSVSRTGQLTNSDIFSKYYMFMRSADMMIYRFHVYSFLHTTTAGVILTSPTFWFNNTICVQLLLGLCANCDMNITLYDQTGTRQLNSFLARGSAKAARHGWPTWRSVTVEHSTDNYNSTRMKLTSKLNSHDFHPLWAVANIRRCPGNASFRTSVLYSTSDASVTCQKLLYDKNTVVNAASNLASNVRPDDAELCPEGKIGPRCFFDCAKIASRRTDNNCLKLVICYKEGCTCPPGFKGYQCSTPCERETYGYNCNQKCNWCNKTSIDVCNKAIGTCTDGCVYDESIIYIPPLCKEGVSKPAPPVIEVVDKTFIKIKHSITWKEEYGKSLFYVYIISPGTTTPINDDWKQVHPNMTDFTKDFTNLEPGTLYNVACLLRVCDQYGRNCSYNVQSAWLKMETDCNPAKFVLRAEQHSLSIDSQPEQIFPCPVNWYQLTVQYTDTNESVLNTNINEFPYEVSNLPSYTNFTVTVSHKEKIIFSRETRTFEEAPSIVLNSKKINVFDTNVILSWTAPEQPHGIIKRYQVTLQIIKYSGCNNAEVKNGNTSHYNTENTKITIQKLHPFTEYEAQIVAYNARYGSEPARIYFKTETSDIATEVFSRLKVYGWNLTWAPPEDCTTITGKLYARIKIRHINDTNFPIVKQTQFSYLLLNKVNLLHAEQYVARVYVIRKANAADNPSAYAELEFTSPPGAPPRVTKLEVYEVDRRENIAIVNLRWQRPTPPLNGILSRYSIRLCTKITTFLRTRRNCIDTKVPRDNVCNLWSDYICGHVQMNTLIELEKIEVVAYNVNVSEPGPSFVVPWEMLNNEVPDEPDNFIVNTLTRGFVDLQWRHPWRTGSRLSNFHITINQLSTNLAELAEKQQSRDNLIVNITDYMSEYTKRLALHPSTRYQVAIEAVTMTGTFGKMAFKEFETSSSLMFNGTLKYEVHDFTITLYIPPVLNYTTGSLLHVVIKGPQGVSGCNGSLRVPKDLQAVVGVDVTSQDVWQAAEIPIARGDIYEPFTIGNNKMYGRAKNCPLRAKSSYDITVAVTERKLNSHIKPIALKITVKNGEILRTRYETWLVPVILILLVAALLLYFYQRKKHKVIKMLHDEMVLSRNIENYEHATKSAMSNSRESLSTPSNRQSLSRTTTPEVAAVTENTDLKELTSLVKVKDFEDYVRMAIQTGLLVSQYEIFPRGQTRPWDYGKLPQNKTKNRYGNLIAYDETRVMLEKLPGDPYSDYINANYITGYKKEKHYIATQGPKPSTVIDFWRMIWQENVLIICMLANVVESGKTKCEQYWPDIGKKKKYGNIIVLNAEHNIFADYCFRSFQVTCGKETRKVEHLHYTAWPDHGVPLHTHSVVTYLKKLLATPPGSGSVVVHCSAGVGRTGTIILCDICLRRAAAEGVVDVFAETASIRNERANMVDNKQQYLLAHLALMECLLFIPTTLPCNETLVARIKELKKQLPIQQQRLQNTAWQDEALRQVTSPPSLSERNRAKNRFPELISDKVSRIYLRRYPASDEDSDYLSAVYVDGVKLQNQYLASQLPMPSTIDDLWRMIAEFRVELVLMLQPPDPEDPTCCAIAPASGEFEPTPYLNITARETVQLECYTSQKLLLVDNSEKPPKERSVTVLCLTQWKPGRNQPPPPVMTMVTLWQAAERIARGDGPTVTLCHDGVTGCGLYLALSFLLERMAVERECDVCLAVRAVRRSRPDFVRSLKHLEYLYDAAVTYLEYFETYANFS